MLVYARCVGIHAGRTIHRSHSGELATGENIRVRLSAVYVKNLSNVISVHYRSLCVLPSGNHMWRVWSYHAAVQSRLQERETGSCAGRRIIESTRAWLCMHQGATYTALALEACAFVFCFVLFCKSHNPQAEFYISTRHATCAESAFFILHLISGNLYKHTTRAAS